VRPSRITETARAPHALNSTRSGGFTRAEKKEVFLS
jgi:hypothetical protein